MPRYNALKAGKALLPVSHLWFLETVFAEYFITYKFTWTIVKTLDHWRNHLPVQVRKDFILMQTMGGDMA